MKVWIKCYLALVFTTVMIGCGGGGDSTVTPTLPKDATTITEANAYDVAWSTVGMFAYVHSRPGLREVDGFTAATSDVIRMVFDKAFVDEALRLQAVASRENITEECAFGGSTSISYNETSTTYSESVSYNGCDEGYVIYNGSSSYFEKQNDYTGNYSYSSNASMSYTLDSGTIVIEVNLEGAGNHYDGSYSYAMAYSQSGEIYNYLFTTTQSFSGVYSDVNSGEILVEGASNTKLLITVINTNLAEVYLDNGSGTLVYLDTISF